ncbi:hypothetical protein ANCDUO_07527 [Ancylostoma duodenale]|uniref:Uncharacterized protein n=1 Tax=Ancylostoma duodenale TaxID=51022 RepID=A0A0C2DI94_9BILA|nr:hypothetical protein ANCDUO_07527 [Ancylostoma duodenale]
MGNAGACRFLPERLVLLLVLVSFKTMTKLVFVCFTTEIADWDSIDSLDRLPSLTDLRILSIPLLESFNEEERIHLVIGRVQNLRVLNGSIITPEQREQSERYFIRYYQVCLCLCSTTIW